MTDAPATRRKVDGLQLWVLSAVTFAVIVVAAFCLILSYHGLYELALAKAPEGSRGMAWMWAVVPDGFLVVGAGAILYYEITGHEDDAWRGWAMVYVATILSILAQGSIASEMTVSGLLVAALPPAVLAVVWAFLMGMVRRTVRPARRPASGRGGSGRQDGAASGGRQGTGQRAGQRREVDARRAGTGDASPNTEGIGGVGAAAAVTGRPGGQLRTVGVPAGRAVTGQPGPGSGRSDPDLSGEERRDLAWRIMAAAADAGMGLPSGEALARQVGGIDGRTGRRWRERFERELDQPRSLRVVE